MCLRHVVHFTTSRFVTAEYRRLFGTLAIKTALSCALLLRYNVLALKVRMYHLNKLHCKKALSLIAYPQNKETRCSKIVYVLCS